MARNDTKMVETAVGKRDKRKYNSKILTTTIGLLYTFSVKGSTGEDSRGGTAIYGLYRYVPL